MLMQSAIRSGTRPVGRLCSAQRAVTWPSAARNAVNDMDHDRRSDDRLRGQCAGQAPRGSAGDYCGVCRQRQRYRYRNVTPMRPRVPVETPLRINRMIFRILFQLHTRPGLGNRSTGSRSADGERGSCLCEASLSREGADGSNGLPVT
jgi:hypothetical protein